MNQQEVWKDIKNYEGSYQASDKGRIKSLSRYVNMRNGKRKIRERILLPALDQQGYLHVNLSGKTIKVHILVCDTFVEEKNPVIKTVVDHMDNDKLNNNATNLQRISQRENCIKDKKGAVGTWKAKGYDKWNAAIRIDGKIKYLGHFNSQKQASDSYKKAYQQIQKQKQYL